jgi:HD-GYP domain-containing protein (c-di-GMP phosphodiesterase class II)
VALEHHERQDGTGAPRGLAGSNKLERIAEGDAPVPTLIGEIAAVANLYDRLLSGHEGREPLRHDVAVNTLHRLAGTWLNAEVVGAFMRIVPAYAKGTEVVVVNGAYRGFEAIVTAVSTTHLDRPLITLVRTARGEWCDPVEIDLAFADHARVHIKYARS